jgi:hypothetical protein
MVCQWLNNFIFCDWEEVNPNLFLCAFFCHTFSQLLLPIRSLSQTVMLRSKRPDRRKKIERTWPILHHRKEELPIVNIFTTHQPPTISFSRFSLLFSSSTPNHGRHGRELLLRQRRARAASLRRRCRIRTASPLLRQQRVWCGPSPRRAHGGQGGAHGGQGGGGWVRAASPPAAELLATGSGSPPAARAAAPHGQSA